MALIKALVVIVNQWSNLLRNYQDVLMALIEALVVIVKALHHHQHHQRRHLPHPQKITELEQVAKTGAQQAEARVKIIMIILLYHLQVPRPVLLLHQGRRAPPFRTETDGDYHIRLKPDPQFSNLVNSANANGQFGDLLLEPICVNPVNQLDAVSACQDFHQNISIPPIGTHVQVTGSYVLDNQHDGWA
jgi:hypothetical protein